MKLYRIDLSEQERTTLLALIQKGKSAARKVRRAHLLLLAAEGQTDRQIAVALHTGTATVERLRKRFVEEGLDAALSEKPRPGARRKLDGKQEAFLVALTCSAPPEGRRCWTMQLLADRLVELGLVASLSDETVRRLLKQTSSNRGSSGTGVCRK
jgi:putative transposase